MIAITGLEKPAEKIPEGVFAALVSAAAVALPDEIAPDPPDVVVIGAVLATVTPVTSAMAFPSVEGMSLLNTLAYSVVL